MERNIIVNENYCPQNHPCPSTRVCPVGAISQKSVYSAPEIDYGKCTRCGICLGTCSAFQCTNC
ncbi:MAG: 4Fe-4S ferredoxin [Bacteroidales bacterium]|jgi:ferredoxin|nr:4Fe-4S ferredoxin [Bacteroidales bacterium]